MAHSKEWNNLAKIILEEAQTLHFLDKDFKITILNMLKSIKEKKKDKELKEIRKTMYEKNEIINK